MRIGIFQAKYIARKMEAVNVALPIAKRLAYSYRALHEFIDKACFFSVAEDFPVMANTERGRDKL